MTESETTPAKVLIVDDNQENIRVLHAVLKDEYTVLFAVNGPGALAIARDQAPALILLDAVMPDMDGYAVCAALRGMPQTRDIPVIFVTALNDTVDETRAFEAGAVDFITKPINPATVKARVKTHITIKHQADQLRELALTDGLTGVANRRSFEADLIRAWHGGERAHLSVALLMVDVDHFKKYNDHYGHQQGDRCLREVAGAIARCLRRPPDAIARYGGEEFVAILPHEDVEGAKHVAQRMLDAVRGLALPHAGSPIGHVTISIGIAAAVPHQGSPESIIVTAADAELYRAKAGGRNRFSSADMVSSE